MADRGDGFAGAFVEGTVAIIEGAIATGDPPLPDLLLGLDFPFPDIPRNPASGSIQTALIIPAACYLFIAYYGLWGSKPARTVQA